MKTIAIFTTTRAEFGILTPFIEALQLQDVLKYQLFVGGAHLALEYGQTIREIREKNFTITDVFDYLLNQDSPESLVQSAGIALTKLAGLFRKYPFDYVCLVGDRFELLTIVQCAILFRKPIIHIHGGESSEGTIDEQIRHMISKAAHLHFVTADRYAENLRKMGESEMRIFNVGALCTDRILRRKKISKQKLYSMLGLAPHKKNSINDVSSRDP